MSQTRWPLGGGCQAIGVILVTDEPAICSWESSAWRIFELTGAVSCSGIWMFGFSDILRIPGFTWEADHTVEVLC